MSITDVAAGPFDAFEKDDPHEECGVFGVWAPDEDVAKLAYFGLYALQHRGQEGAGIAVGDGDSIVVFKDTGLVSQIFDEPVLNTLQGSVAIGHTRYATAGAGSWENVQPIYRTTPNGTDLALAHNGNLINYEYIHRSAVERGLLPESSDEKNDGSTSDTNVMAALMAHSVTNDVTVLDSARQLLPTLKGAFCLVFTDGKTLYAARDPHGVRPLALGRLERGWVVASETCALDIVGASFVRYIEPGELVAIDEAGVHSEFFSEASPRKCIFEQVYVARPDSVIDGRTVNATRLDIGRRLAREYPVDADLVIPVPESGTPAAVGYARESGIPFGQGLVKNAYVGRTFIQPTQTLRQLGIRLKLNPLREVIEGKRLVVVDDSIVRGNTQRALIRMLREAGAAEIHVRIASPPVKWPCFYGLDFASPGELIANMGGQADGDLESVTEFIATAIGADSLGFVSVEELIASTTMPAGELCTACFTGDYPLGLPSHGPNADAVRKIQALSHEAASTDSATSTDQE